MYEMMTGAPPFYSKNKEQIFRDVLSKPVPMMPHFSPALCELLGGLMQIAPEKRLAEAEVVKRSAWFGDLDWERCMGKELEPPFKPAISSEKDVRYFDKLFTGEDPKESPPSNSLDSAQKAANRYEGFTFKGTEDLV